MKHRLKNRAAERAHGQATSALKAAAAIVQMDPHARDDLITYMKAFNKAQAANDEEQQEYLVQAILEMFEVGGSDDGGDLDAWADEIKCTPAGRAAAKALAAETGAFFAAYQRQKARSGLTTIRAVAQAAGLSPTTVQAIEKQRVKPQFKTMQALGRAFGVPVKMLSGK